MVEIEFDMKCLVKKYGSWVRVQVAFYDFLFMTATKMSPKNFRETVLVEIASGGFADGEGAYEKAMSILEETFATPESAWVAFLIFELEDNLT